MQVVPHSCQVFLLSAKACFCISSQNDGKAKAKIEGRKGVFMLRLGLSYEFVILTLKSFMCLEDKSVIFLPHIY